MTRLLAWRLLVVLCYLSAVMDVAPLILRLWFGLNASAVRAAAFLYAKSTDALLLVSHEKALLNVLSLPWNPVSVPSVPIIGCRRPLLTLVAEQQR